MVTYCIHIACASLGEVVRHFVLEIRAHASGCQVAMGQHHVILVVVAMGQHHVTLVVVTMSQYYEGFVAVLLGTRTCVHVAVLIPRTYAM